jgi:hypothetical protein
MHIFSLTLKSIASLSYKAAPFGDLWMHVRFLKLRPPAHAAPLHSADKATMAMFSWPIFHNLLVYICICIYTAYNYWFASIEMLVKALF